MINIYLCGAMQGVTDRGAGWRDQMCELVAEHNDGTWIPLGPKSPGGTQSYSVIPTPPDDKIHVFYPQRIEESILRYAPRPEDGSSENITFDKVAMRAVIFKDLAMVKHSDVVIAYIDDHINRSAGSLSEMTYALAEGIPVIGLIGDVLAPGNMRDWAKACVTMSADTPTKALSMAIVAAKEKIFRGCYANPERPLPLR